MQQENVLCAAQDGRNPAGMIRAAQDGNTPANYLTLAEAAAFLGLKKSYLYKLTSTRQIPFFKYGGRLVLFDRAALETWRAARLQAVPTLADAQAHAAAYCAANPLK